MSKKYIHYGSSKFDINKFNHINYKDVFPIRTIKPYGGLWASPVDSSWNWYDWCICNDFNLKALNEYFKFELKNDAKVLYVNSIDDIKKYYINTYGHNYIDFEYILFDHYDAMEVTMNSETYHALYGWDVDSLVVFNPDCIILEQ